MSGLIPDSFIDALMERTDIVEVIERRLPLKRAGREYQARCPFHDEKTPSFTVSPQKQFYHCFGCGAHGTAIGFLMQYDGLEFPAAVEELARSAGLEVPKEAGTGPRIDQSLFEVTESASRFYQSQLRDNRRAVDYLKQRGVSGEIARTYGIGYAPEGYHVLEERLKASEEDLKRVGLLAVNERGSYDKFRDRIMFPIQDLRGRTIGFGGRALTGSGPKYLNSPETELFHKGKEVYGLNIARAQPGRVEQLVVVEGYMDVVALAEADIPFAVATLGTAVTGDQVERLFRTAATVTFCFDGDRAGREAAWRGLKACLPKMKEGRTARFLFLPDGHDPDSLVKEEGRSAFLDRLGSALSLSEALFQKLEADLDLAVLEDRARLLERGQPLVQKLPEGVLKELLVEELESRARHSVERAASEPRPARRRQAPHASPVRVAIANLAVDPGLARGAELRPEAADSSLPGVGLLGELIDFCAQQPNMKTAGLVERWRDHEFIEPIRRLVAEAPALEPEIRAAEFSDAMARVNLELVSERIKELQTRQAREPLTEPDKQELLALLSAKTELRRNN